MKKERRVAAQVRRKSSPAESSASAKVLRAHACCQEQREATLAFTGAGGRGTDEQKGARGLCKPQQKSGGYFRFNSKTPEAVKRQSSDRIRLLF